jgi:hypothetical protein
MIHDKHKETQIKRNMRFNIHIFITYEKKTVTSVTEQPYDEKKKKERQSKKTKCMVSYTRIIGG